MLYFLRFTPTLLCWRLIVFNVHTSEGTFKHVANAISESGKKNVPSETTSICKDYDQNDTIPIWDNYSQFWSLQNV